MLLEDKARSDVNTPVVPAVPDRIQRPFWSVMIPTYNPRNDYLEQAIDGVLAQDWGAGEVQIELVDDASDKFDPASFLEKRGEPRLSCHRKRQRTGIGGNWNTCIERARGHWVHILHQDDLVLPGFYERLGEGIAAEPELGAAFCQGYILDEEGAQGGFTTYIGQEEPGLLSDWVEHVFVGLAIQTPTIVVNRRVYETLGGFDTDLRYVVDWEMWKRIAARYPIWYEPMPLAGYRKHSSATTRALQKTGRNLDEIRLSIDNSAAYLSPSIADDVVERTREHYTQTALGFVWERLFVDRDLGAALTQLRGARRIHSTRMLARSAFILARNAWNNRRKA